MHYDDHQVVPEGRRVSSSFLLSQVRRGYISSRLSRLILSDLRSFVRSARFLDRFPSKKTQKQKVVFLSLIKRTCRNQVEATHGHGLACSNGA